MMFVLMLGIAVVIGLTLVGVSLGTKPVLLIAVALLLLAAPVILYFFSASEVLVTRDTVVIDETEGSREDTSAQLGVNSALVPSQDPALKEFAALLSQQQVLSVRARPAWADQSPGLEKGVYRWPVKSGLYSTQEECRQALATAVAEVVAQYGKTLLADPNAAEVLLSRPDWLVEMQSNHDHPNQQGSYRHQGIYYEYRESEQSQPPPGTSVSTEPLPFPQATASGHTNLIEQPLFAEKVQASVGQMQQLHALLEFGDTARGQIREAWRHAAIPRRLRWAACGFGAVLAMIGIVLTALRFDLASGGRHRGRLRWAAALVILVVVGSAYGLCLL